MEAILYKAEQTAIPELLETIPMAASLISVLLQMKTSGKERSAAISLIYFSADRVISELGSIEIFQSVLLHDQPCTNHMSFFFLFPAEPVSLSSGQVPVPGTTGSAPLLFLN